MTHSFVKIFIHCTWATKHRERVLTSESRSVLHQHLREYALQNSIILEALNVQIDHVHVLISLKSNQNLDTVIQLLKGESSHWINTRNLIREKFGWQRGYGAFSISATHEESVRNYIDKQDEHHRRTSFTEEYSRILGEHGLLNIDDHQGTFHGISPLEADKSAGADRIS